MLRVALAGALLRLLRLDLAIARRRARGQRADESLSDFRDLLDGLIEDTFVGLGGSSGAAQFSDELESRRPDLIVTGRRIEVR